MPTEAFFPLWRSAADGQGWCCSPDLLTAESSLLTQKKKGRDKVAGKLRQCKSLSRDNPMILLVRLHRAELPLAFPVTYLPGSQVNGATLPQDPFLVSSKGRTTVGVRSWSSSWGSPASGIHFERLRNSRANDINKRPSFLFLLKQWQRPPQIKCGPDVSCLPSGV